MIRTLAAVALCAALPLSAFAQEKSPADLALAALEQFDDAHSALERAQSATDRVDALSRVIRAYEEGMEAMRAGLRQVSLREAALEHEFQDESGRVATLLGVLINLSPGASPDALIHPTGPVGHARAGMLVSSITPAMQAEAEDLRVKLQEVTILRELQTEAMATLAVGLRDVQTARTALSQAMSERTDLPKRLVADPDRVAALVQSSDSLESFASGLAVIDVVDGTDGEPQAAAVKGRWAYPVAGTPLRAFNEADAAGIKRPGWLFATRPLSLVMTPAPATIRYQGPFLDYGNVMILEPANDVLLILAGLDETYGEVGDVVPGGEAIGLMGGSAPDLDDFIENATRGTGTGLSETLYIEVREGGQPVDPADWFD